MTLAPDALPTHRSDEASRRACFAALNAISATRPLTWAEGVAWAELDLAIRRARRSRALKLPALIEATRRRVDGLTRGMKDRGVRRATVAKAQARLTKLEQEAADLARG